MDPLNALTSLTRAVNYLWELSEKVKQNREECQRLAAHASEVLNLIEKDIKNGVSSAVSLRLQKLTSSLTTLISILDELSNQPMLKKILWRARIADKITETYRSLSEAIQLFDLGEKLDLRRFYEEKETARQVDIENLQKVIEKGNQDYFQALEIQKADMQEAMMALHKRLLAGVENTLEKKFLEQGMHAIQRRTGGLDSIPDEYVITSLDVVIHYDKKLGQGGSGQVFQADWQGTTVAIKIFGKGVPSSVF